MVQTKKVIVYMIVGAMLFLSGYMFGYSDRTPCPACSLHTSCPAPNITIPKCPDVNCNCPKVSQIKEIVQAVHDERPYHYPYWDCSEMSQALMDRLDNAGYWARRFCNERHCWVEVRDKGRWGLIVEATSGDIPTPYTIKENRWMYWYVYKDV